MAIPIGGYHFDGPFDLSSTWKLQNRSGVYVILTDTGSNYTVLDVGESGDVRSRVETHDRQDCWARNMRRGLYVAALYCDAYARARIEQELRQQFSPVCGVR